MTFRDQVVLVTGASSGIGQRLAIDLAGRGAIVIGCSRSRERLQETLAAMRRTSPASAVIPCDVGDREQAHAMIQNVLAERGKIDILINNAGIGMRKPFVETSADIIEDIMRTNYFGMVHCTRAVLPSMIARGSGHIVNISSSLGKIGTFNMAAYCASKFAMNGLSESLYHELKPLGIHVSVVCPGAVRTAFNKTFSDIPPKSPSFLAVGPESVSAVIIRAIEKNRFEVVTPRWLAWVFLFKRLMPGLFLAVFHRAFRSRVAAQRKRQA